MGSWEQSTSQPIETDCQLPPAQQVPQVALPDEQQLHAHRPQMETNGANHQPSSSSMTCSAPPTSSQRPGNDQSEDQSDHLQQHHRQPPPCHEADGQHPVHPPRDLDTQAQDEQRPQEPHQEGRTLQDQPELQASYTHSDPDGRDDEEWITIPEEEGDPSPEGTLEEDMDWISDVSDTEEEEDDPVPPSRDRHERHEPQREAGGNPKKRAAGHGSQRVKNKARKSDIKKLWSQAGWGQKPEWLTWRAALAWLKRVEKPPDKQPRSSAEDRAKLASLLAAHQYERDSDGKIIPTTAASSPSTTSDPQPTSRGASTSTTASTPGISSPTPRPQGKVSRPAAGAEQQATQDTSKAANQARRDHQQRTATNPYRQPPQHSQQRMQQQQQTQRPLPAQPPPRSQARQEQPPQQALPPGRGRRVAFDLPPDHREHPPLPVRQQKVWRKPTDSTTLQLKFDGTSRRPIRVVDNRPEHPRTGGDPNDNTNRAQEEHMEGDVLFVQPTHLTASSSASSSDNTPPGAPQPTIDDLEEQARQAVREGRAPQWDIEDATSSMRSSIRIGDVSFDLSWLQGAGPPTLPPTIPIARNVVFTARASLAGAWRGVL